MSATSDSQKRTYKVRIFNQTYSIVSSASEGEFELIAAQVDHLMHTIASRSGSADGTRAAVMAAMHLADKLRQSERRLQSFQDEQQQALEHVGERTDYLERLLRETLEMEEAPFVPCAPEPDLRAAAEEPSIAVAEPDMPVAEPEIPDAEQGIMDAEAGTTARSRRGRRESPALTPTLFSLDGPEDESIPSAV